MQYVSLFLSKQVRRQLFQKERIQTVMDFFYVKSIGIVRKETLGKVYGTRARKPLQLHSLYA